MEHFNEKKKNQMLQENNKYGRERVVGTCKVREDNICRERERGIYIGIKKLDVVGPVNNRPSTD